MILLFEVLPYRVSFIAPETVGDKVIVVEVAAFALPEKCSKELMATVVPVFVPTRFKFAPSFTALAFKSKFKTKIALLDVLTPIHVAFVVDVVVLTTFNVSASVSLTLYDRLLLARINLFALATYFSTAVPSKKEYKIVSGLKSDAEKATALSRM